MGFASLTQVRPGLIGGERESVRAGEAALALVLGALAPVLPARWRINPAERIAQALLEAALAGHARRADHHLRPFDLTTGTSCKAMSRKSRWKKPTA